MRSNRRYRFTVLTPTYNRAHTITRVYDSLRRQTFRDFEWVVVDDGSIDGTRRLVEGWITEAALPIRYFWQENAHKKSAFNRGVKEAKGELILPLDSDDEILPDALAILDGHWCSIKESQREEFSAVTGLCIDEQGRIVGDKFPGDIFDSDSLEIRYRYRIRGEKCGFQRADILRQFPYPESVHGHVPEGVVWSAIAANYKTRFVNDILRIYHHEKDSITQVGVAGGGAEKNADGHALWAREVLSNEWRWLHYHPAWFMKIAANYTRFHLHLRKAQPTKRWPLRGVVPLILVALMWPVGIWRYWLDVRKSANG